MNLASPTNLLWILPICAAIVALYFLKMRRPEIRVPKTFLWPKHTEELRANSLFQKPKFSWLLVLQLLAVILLCAAFSRPQVQQRSLFGETTVIVLDSSASMLATDVSPNRFESAKQIVLNALSTTNPTDRVALISAGKSPKVIFGLTSDARRQSELVRRLNAAETVGDLGESLRLASALVSGLESSRILVISDGCFAKIENFSPGKASVVYKNVGLRHENVAITAVGSAKTSRGNEVYVGLKNYGLNQTTVEVDVFADGKLFFTQKPVLASLKPGGLSCLAPANAKVISAKIQTKDLLDSDNTFFASCDSGSNLTVLLVSKGNPFLERALLLDPRVVLDRTDQVPTENRTYDLVVFDSIEPQPINARMVVSFGASNKNTGAIDRAKGSGKVLTQNSGGILKDVDLSTVYFESPATLEPVAGGKAIASTESGPLITISDDKTIKVACGFSLFNSDFPLQTSFPIFIGNLIDLIAIEGTNQNRFVRTGSEFSIRSSVPLKLVGPDGKSVAVSPVGSELAVKNLDRVGEYSLSEGSQVSKIFANLRSEIESDIAPKQSLDTGKMAVKSVSVPLQMRDYWRWILLFGLGVLGFEWWLFTRKD